MNSQSTLGTVIRRKRSDSCSLEKGGEAQNGPAIFQCANVKGFLVDVTGGLKGI